MQVIDTGLEGVKIIEPQVFGDERGFFLESWNREKFEAAGMPANFVQDNHSRSTQGVLRGLHYQIKQPQGKLVRATLGEVHLSESNRRFFYVPPGFAHGFYVISEFAEFQYKCTDYYAPEFERSLLWNDPELGIDWPLVGGTAPQLSAKDQNCPVLSKADVFK